jgi:hypothetical protein
MSKDKALEVVFVSMDRNQAAFNVSRAAGHKQRSPTASKPLAATLQRTRCRPAQA